MFFARAAVILAVAAAAVALPMSADGPSKQKRAGGVLTASSYADFQVSDGVAGKALDEVKAKFPVGTRPY